MLASELIKTYEEFCPQELSMEGDVVALPIGSPSAEAICIASAGWELPEKILMFFP